MQTLRVTVDNDSTMHLLIRMLSTIDGVQVKEVRQTGNRDAGNALLQLCGIWKDRDVTTESIRKAAWKRAAE